MNNQLIAERLMAYARYLNEHDPNLYRRRAYRRAAETLLRLDRPVAHIIEEQGRKGLEALPGIGSHLAYTIEGLVRTGEFRTLTRGEAPVKFEVVVADN
jgi:DNA polymerase (family 10)